MAISSVMSRFIPKTVDLKTFQQLLTSKHSPKNTKIFAVTADTFMKATQDLTEITIPRNLLLKVIGSGTVNKKVILEKGSQLRAYKLKIKGDVKTEGKKLKVFATNNLTTDWGAKAKVEIVEGDALNKEGRQTIKVVDGDSYNFGKYQKIGETTDGINYGNTQIIGNAWGNLENHGKYQRSKFVEGDANTYGGLQINSSVNSANNFGKGIQLSGVTRNADNYNYLVKTEGNVLKMTEDPDNLKKGVQLTGIAVGESTNHGNKNTKGIQLTGISSVEKILGRVLSVFNI
ncbi:MAG: hypothetical protein WCG23_05595 [bacterium]